MSDHTPAPSTHFVSNAPFDPYLVEADNDKSGSHASQLRLTWWRFRRHKLALVSAILLLAAYLAITVIEFLAPYNVHTRNVDNIYAPPQQVHLFHEGAFVGPFVYGRTMTLDMKTLRRNYADDTGDVQKLRFFCRGDSYRFWGMAEGNVTPRLSG